MVSLEQAGTLAAAMPEATEGSHFGNRTWFVGKKSFAWERPFSKADLKRFGDTTPPSGPIIAVRVADLMEKEAILGVSHKGVFTISHFDGYAALLIQLNTVSKKVLQELIVDAWLSAAPKALAKAYLANEK